VNSLLLDGHVRPIKGASAEKHIPYKRLNRRLPNEPHEEELLDDGRTDGAEGRQAQKQLAEARGLVRVLGATVLLQRALRLFLDAVNVVCVGDAAGI